VSHDNIDIKRFMTGCNKS